MILKIKIPHKKNQEEPLIERDFDTDKFYLETSKKLNQRDPKEEEKIDELLWIAERQIEKHTGEL